MERLSSLLEQRILEVQRRIETAARKAGRNPDDVKIIGVTKNVDGSLVRIAKELGMIHFGENRVQHFLENHKSVPDACWHFIGRLQTNKVKYIIDKVYLIHSLDRMNLAEEISRVAQKLSITANVLVQVNVSGEETKAGVAPESCEQFLIEVSKLPNIRVKGLMTMAPYWNDKAQIGHFFASLYKLFIDIRRKKIHNINMEYLSAGMTNDFEIAVEQGANIVRIGTAIFGDL